MTEHNDEQRGAPQPAIQHYGVTTGRFPPRRVGFGGGTHTVYPIKHMVAVGRLNAGFQFYGPFAEATFAARWAFDNLKRGMEYQVYPIFDVRESA